VLFDRLAPHARLAELAPDAELVDVGKRPGHHAIPQHEIEALLVGHALAGRHAVRLKGGDPYVLGRGSEEVLACHRAGVPVEVVPGVTSAVAVPGAAGIPLTHRGVSHLFTVVSGHAPLTDDELRHLAGLGGTIVVLMGVNTLPMLAAGLARHGMRGSMPVAIVERGFRRDQRTTVADLGGIVTAAGAAGVSSPAVIVVGEVVRLAHDGDQSAAQLMERAAGFSAVVA
jgi:uroporphyrin-III C-methyltransferase